MGRGKITSKKQRETVKWFQAIALCSGSFGFPSYKVKQDEQKIANLIIDLYVQLDFAESVMLCQAFKPVKSESVSSTIDLPRCRIFFEFIPIKTLTPAF